MVQENFRKVCKTSKNNRFNLIITKTKEINKNKFITFCYLPNLVILMLVNLKKKT